MVLQAATIRAPDSSEERRRKPWRVRTYVFLLAALLLVVQVGSGLYELYTALMATVAWEAARDGGRARTRKEEARHGWRRASQWPVQLRHPTAHTSEKYVSREGWRDATLDGCGAMKKLEIQVLEFPPTGSASKTPLVKYSRRPTLRSWRSCLRTCSATSTSPW